MSLALANIETTYVSQNLPATIANSDAGQLTETLFGSLFDQRDKELEAIKSVHSKIAGEYTNVLSYFGWSYRTVDNAKKVMDTEYWRKVIESSDLVDAMTSKRKAEWEESIKTFTTPEFTRENVLPTIHHLISSQGIFFAERVESVFNGVSDKHITNSPAGFAKRIIFAPRFNGLDTGITAAATLLDDLRVVTAIILNRAPLKLSKIGTHKLLTAMAQREEFGQWIPFDGHAMRVKLFKKGTVHVELNPLVAYKLNDVLAMLYPMALPESFRRKPKKQDKEFAPLVDNVISVGALTVLDELRSINPRCDNTWHKAFPDHDVVYYFSHSTKTSAHLKEASSVLTQLGATPIHSTKTSAHLKEASSVLTQLGATPIHSKLDAWECDYNLIEAVKTVLRLGAIPDKKSYQYYPSKGDIGKRAANALKDVINVDGSSLLEPSAGQAHLAQHLPKSRLTLVELSSVNATILSQKGYDKVYCDDFLVWAKANQNSLFDGILMNPPYSQRQAIEHVNAAMTLLDHHGVLVCIVPIVAAESLKEHDGDDFMVEKLEQIDGAFDDANVSVCIVRITRQN